MTDSTTDPCQPEVPKPYTPPTLSELGTNGLKPKSLFWNALLRLLHQD